MTISFSPIDLAGGLTGSSEGSVFPTDTSIGRFADVPPMVLLFPQGIAGTTSRLRLRGRKA